MTTAEASTNNSHAIATATNRAMQTILERHNSEYEQIFAETIRNMRSSVQVAKRSQSGPVERSNVSPIATRRRSHVNVAVLDSEGRELERDHHVLLPDGATGTITRFNRSQKRVVVLRDDTGQQRMVTGHRVTILDK